MVWGLTAWYFIPIAACFGGAIVWLVAGHFLALARISSSVQEARAVEAERQVESLRLAIDELRARYDSLAQTAAGLESDKAHLREVLETDQRRLSEVREQMRLEFENLASRLLEEKSARFLEQNQQSLVALLTPFRERIGEFRERMEMIHTEETRQGASLSAQLKQLHELNRQMTEEAGHLTSALRGQAKAQGTWGELVLERILEKSGLTKGLEYETQVALDEEGGGRRLPDVLIRLPDSKSVVVDSKVSLTAYERSLGAETDVARAAALREHSASLRRHVDELSRKNYPSLKSLQSPDFVLMFVPVEPALHLALESDPSLYGDAFSKNVILVSSSTLLVALRAVESVWRHHKQTVNAQEIARQAGALHDGFVNFLEALEDIGKRLGQAKEAYDLSVARLSQGRGNLVKRTMDLQKLGARAEKSVPPSIARPALESSGEDGEPAA